MWVVKSFGNTPKPHRELLYQLHLATPLRHFQALSERGLGLRGVAELQRDQPAQPMGGSEVGIESKRLFQMQQCRTRVVAAVVRQRQAHAQQRAVAAGGQQAFERFG